MEMAVLRCPVANVLDDSFDDHFRKLADHPDIGDGENWSGDAGLLLVPKRADGTLEPIGKFDLGETKPGPRPADQTRTLSAFKASAFT